MSMDHPIIREEARLIILRALHEQTNKSLTSTALRAHLADLFLIDRERPWVEQEMAYLAEMGAVRLVVGGTVKIAQLLPHGESHLAWRVAIPGVLRPSQPVI